MGNTADESRERLFCAMDKFLEPAANVQYQWKLKKTRTEKFVMWQLKKGIPNFLINGV